MGGREVARIDGPTRIAPRDWRLGVVAVQAVVDRGRVAARLRAHLTGWPKPRVAPLLNEPGDGEAVVHVAYGDGAPPERIPAPPPSAEAATLDVYLDGVRLAGVALSSDRVGASPAPRAFGHVFCRYQRAGDGAFDEAGFDLTDFLSLPPGVKYERVLSATLRPGQVVTYLFCASPNR